MPRKVLKLSLVYEPGWRYYINYQGNVMRVMTNESLPKGHANNPQLVKECTLPPIYGFFGDTYYGYFMDADGDVCELTGNESFPEVPQANGAGSTGAQMKMITKRFEYTDAISNKFWEIRYPETGTSYTASWGKIGSLGSSKTKHKTTLKEIEKKIQEKIIKGYQLKVTVSSKKSGDVPVVERDPSPFDIY